MVSWQTTIALLLCLAAGIVAAKPKRLSKRERLDRDLREYYVKVDQRLFGERDYRMVARKLHSVEGDDSLRPLVVSLLSQYHRRMSKDPVSGLRVLAPEVLGGKQAKQWLRVLKNAEAKRKAKHRDAVRQAYLDRTDPPAKPDGLALPFPHKQMQITENNVECALEVARCLMAVARVQEALQVIDAQGRRFSGEGRVLSYECLGDLQLRMHVFEPAVSSYQAGLKLLNSLKPTEGFDAWQKLLHSRLQRKLAQARRLWDMNRYGAGYVAYRDAERKRRKEKSYLDAMLRYDVIIEKYPKTVYAEASKCYRVKCLLALSERETLPKSAAKAVADARKALAETKELVRLAKKYRVPKASIAEFQAEVKQHEQRIKELQSLPYGKKALAAAKESARAFVKENLFGLYRPETLIDIANYAFEEELDPERAEKYYRQAWQVMEKAPSADARLARIPAKAAKVAAPQQVATKTNMFGNIKRQEGVAIGAVLNRRTAPWYLDRLRAKAVMAIGFLCFYREQNEEAKTWYKLIPKYDPKTRKLAAKGQWNDLKRLNWGADNGHLYAHPVELKLFKRRRRFAILLADFYFCTERFARCSVIARKILNGHCGKLSKAQEQYPQFLLASAVYWDKGAKASFLILKRLIENSGSSYTRDRAMFSAGNICNQPNDKKIWELGNEYLRQLIKSGHKNHWVGAAYVTYGPRLVESGRRKEGLAILRACPKSDKDHYGIAQWYIKGYLEEENKKKEKEVED